MSDKPPIDRRLLRAAQGADAVLTETEAVALLPSRDSNCREWLRERGLVRVTPLGRIVLWRDVLEALRGAPDGPEEAHKRRGTPSGLARSLRQRP